MAIGCGGSSGGKNDGGGGDGASASGGADGHLDGGPCVAEEPPGGVTSWSDDGVSRCALIIQTTHMSGTSSDNFHLIAVDPGDVSITLEVATYGGALGGRSYHCQPDGGTMLQDGGASDYASFQYSGGAGSYAAQDCMITIDAPGAPGGDNARGSFSATLAPLGGGATKTISNGVFDTAVNVNGG